MNDKVRKLICNTQCLKPIKNGQSAWKIIDLIIIVLFSQLHAYITFHISPWSFRSCLNRILGQRHGNDIGKKHRRRKCKVFLVLPLFYLKKLWHPGEPHSARLLRLHSAARPPGLPGLSPARKSLAPRKTEGPEPCSSSHPRSCPRHGCARADCTCVLPSAGHPSSARCPRSTCCPHPPTMYTVGSPPRPNHHA